MGWQIGECLNHDRFIGYGVPAECDHPDCTERIDRGLAYVCGGNPYGEPNGCGLFFCYAHLFYAEDDEITEQLCERCCEYFDKKLEHCTPFDPKPDIAEWVQHQLTDPSWAEWRIERGIEAAPKP